MCQCDFQYLNLCVILQTERLLQQYTKFDDSDDDVDDDNELDEQEITKLLSLYSREWINKNLLFKKKSLFYCKWLITNYVQTQTSVIFSNISMIIYVLWIYDYTIFCAIFLSI